MNLTKQNLNLLINYINDNCKDLADPTKIRIQSEDLDDIGLEGNNQEAALEFLASRGCIRFVTEHRYDSVDDIDEVDFGWIEESNNPEEMIDMFLSFRIHDIELLKEINNKTIDEKYVMTYKGQQLCINGILLAKPDFFSENDKFLEFIFRDGGKSKRVEIGDMLEAMRVSKTKKTIHQILNDVNIKGEVRKQFFPSVSSKGFEFINPITFSYARNNELSDIDFEQLIGSNKK